MSGLRSKALLLVPAGLLVFLISLPWISSYALIWIFLLAVYLTLSLSYDLVGGYLGYMNLGHSTYFGLGAYGTAILLNLDCGLPLALGLAVLLTAAFAAVISVPLFRLKGAYFALATFGLINLIEVLCTNLRGLTGGSGGISTPSGDHILPAYYISLGVAAGTMVLSHFLARSPFGLALVSIREDEEVARSCGLPATSYKWAAMIISSIPSSLIGGVYVWDLTYINPSAVFGLEIALTPIIMAMLGGTGLMMGPVIGVIFLTVVQELIWTQIPYFHLTIYGVLLVFLGLFMPGGIVRTRWVSPILRGLGLGAEIDYLKVPKSGTVDYTEAP
jgi:branched-chain amino acid transport system permease protein